MPLEFAYLRYSAAFKSPVRTAHGIWAKRDGLLLRLKSADGAEAYGDVTPIDWFGTESIEEAEAFCRTLGGKIEDETLANLPQNYAALARGFETARSDLISVPERDRGAAEEVNVGSAPAYLPVAALLPAGKAALEKIAVLADAGFRTFKWKVGVGDAADELGILDDLIARLPAGAKLRLDANGAWDRRKAERWLERCAERPIEFVEQPIARENPSVRDVTLGLANDYPTRIALDESVATGREIDAWLELGWPGIFVVKPQLLGRADETLKKLARRKNDVVFSSALETAIGARAALKLAFAFGANERALGFGVWPLFEDPRLDGPRLAPFIRREDLDTIRPEEIWNALS